MWAQGVNTLLFIVQFGPDHKCLHLRPSKMSHTICLNNWIIMYQQRKLQAPNTYAFQQLIFIINCLLIMSLSEVPALTDQMVQLLKDVIRSTSVAKTYDVAKGQITQRVSKNSIFLPILMTIYSFFEIKLSLES